MTPKPVIVIRYSEIGLKGRNRPDFEKALVANVKHALRGQQHGPVEHPHGRLVVRDPADPPKAAAATAEVFGVASVSPGVSVAADLDTISRQAPHLVEDALAQCTGEGDVPFRVTCQRSDKSFCHNSMEVASRLGAELLGSFQRLKVDLKNPRITLGVEIRRDEALLFSRRIEGPGGMPVGSLGNAVTLLSGGIDSPVAAWLAMKRGARMLFINYHSYPFISGASLTKVEGLVQRLAHFQRGAALFVAPFADIQVAIKQACPEPLRTVLYRRMMVRLANRLAARAGAHARVTGASHGPLASQPLENIRCIGAVADYPVLSPLISFDKTEIIALARKIGTYDISIQPFPDCCTVFQPRNPRIAASLEEVEAAERALDVESLVTAAFDGLEKKVFT